MSFPSLKLYRIAIVDDHAMVRDGLRFQFSAHADLEVCGEADSVESGVTLVEESRPDLVIVDISLREGNGIDLIKRIRALGLRAKILVTSMYNESLYAERALRAGAEGYLNKQESRERLMEAIRTVLAGRPFVSPQLTERLISRATAAGSTRNTPVESPVEMLSPRELEVFHLIGEGMTTGRIARKLRLSPHTIDTHREKIKHKLGLSNGGELQREAVQWVLENG